MSVPYEPIIRHGNIAGRRMCQPCVFSTINHPCGNPACYCECNVGVKVTTTEQFPEFPEFRLDIADQREEAVTRLTEGLDLPRDIFDPPKRDDVLHMDKTIEMEWHGGKATPVLAGIAVGAGAVGFGESGFALPAALLILGITLIIIGIRLRSSRA